VVAQHFAINQSFSGHTTPLSPARIVVSSFTIQKSDVRHRKQEGTNSVLVAVFPKHILTLIKVSRDRIAVMQTSLWKTPDGSWAVCEGPGPTGVKGYVEFRNGWRIVPDTSGTVYMNAESAAAKV